jgi:multidrug efflux pump subunit AcrA (membrane-fusion protein)
MKSQRSERNRRGAVLLIVLVCLIVITLVCVTLMRQGVAARGQVRAEERRLQAKWLAESGLERASARLANEADYQGETWTVSPDALGGPWPGRVTIVVAPVDGQGARRSVRVEADYPSGAALRARQRIETLIDLKSVPTGETQ